MTRGVQVWVVGTNAIENARVDKLTGRCRAIHYNASILYFNSLLVQMYAYRPTYVGVYE